MNNIRDLFNLKLIDTQHFEISIYSVLLILAWIIGLRIALFLIRKILNKTESRKKLNQNQTFVIYQIIKYFVIVIAVVVILQSLGLNLTILTASSAALFVGIGLGLQQVFKDMFAGLILLFTGTIRIGDIIEIENIVAKVTGIGFRTSTVVTRDDIDMIIPNSLIISEKVINWSYNNDTTRFTLEIGVAYGSDVDLVKNLLMEAAGEHPEVSKEPEPFVRFTDFGESSLDFQLLFWSKNMYRIENVLSDLRFSIDKKFRNHGVSIPFPQRDVHIRTNKL
ncbi:MAG: mechanosensitive ion channel [Bacteroidetes bacterium]|nr:mechanosensitive ion channel [Bacteroidota bacterium]